MPRLSLRRASRCLLACPALFYLVACDGPDAGDEPLAALPQRRPVPSPNIVLLVADDLGWGDVGYHGSEIETPKIDRLAREGIELDRFYVYPVCSPTRAALLSGRSALQLGVTEPITAFTDWGIPRSARLLPEILGEHGYQTFLLGKWHLGIARPEQHPNRHGFDLFYGSLGGFIDHYRHTYSGAHDWQRNGVDVREEGYATRLVIEETVERLRARDRGRPFFLMVAFHVPHTPLEAPEELIERNRHVDDPERRRYAAMVTALDDGVGRIVETLEQEGILEETVVFFLSDNGGGSERGMFGAAGASNAPLRGFKASVFEGGIRVPAAVWWPGVLEGARSRQLISVHDVAPTLLSAVGAGEELLPTAAGYRGRDLFPALRDGDAVERGEVLVGSLGAYALLTEEWKLIQIEPRYPFSDPGVHLFRITEDPRETTDLAASRPDTVAALLDRLASYRRDEIVRPSFLQLPDYLSEEEERPPYARLRRP